MVSLHYSAAVFKEGGHKLQLWWLRRRWHYPQLHQCLHAGVRQRQPCWYVVLPECQWWRLLWGGLCRIVIVKRDQMDYCNVLCSTARVGVEFGSGNGCGCTLEVGLVA